MIKRQPISYFLLDLILTAVLMGTSWAVITGFNSPYDVAILPNHGYFYVTNSGNNTVSIVNTLSNTIIGTITGFNRPEGIVSTPDGTFAYVADFGTNELLGIDASTNSITEIIGGFDQPSHVSLSADGKTVYVTSQGSNTVGIVDLTQISPVNIIIESFSVSPSPVSAGLPVTFTMNLLNNGQLASGTIGVNLVITGPQSFDFSESAGALLPSQSEQLSFVFGSIAGTAGSYTATATATFNAISQSNPMSVAYSVTPPVTPPIPAPTTPTAVVVPVVTLPQLEFTQVPFYSSLELGSTLLSSMGIKNIIGVPETVVLSIPQQFAKMFSLSAYSLYLMPGQSLIVQMVFNSNNVNQSGAYVVPINIGLKALNGTQVNRTQYLAYEVEKSSYNVSLYNQVSIAQNNATVTTTLVGARNTSLTNATLITMLPSSVVNNASQIKTYGLPATITTVNGTQDIKWLVPYLPAGKTITLSYTIINPLNIGLLSSVQNLLMVPSQAVSASILRVVSIQTPTFYTNSTNRILVGVLYTGTLQQKVKFMLTTTGAVDIINPVQVVNATPNQLLQQAFIVRTYNTTGTALCNLSIETPNASVSYTLPLIVLSKPPSGTTSTTIPPTIISGNAILKYVPLALGIAVLIIIVLKIKGMRKRHRYDPEKAKELIRVREQIKRSDEHA